MRALLAACTLAAILPVKGLAQGLAQEQAPGQAQPFSFGVLAPLGEAGLSLTAWREALAVTDADSLAFVVANGIKASGEPCSDRLYGQRKDILDSAKNGVILSLAAGDWVDCKRANGRSAGVERLARLREIFFSGEFSLGGTRLPLHRQSTIPMFRGYGENARWEVGDVMFATLHLPADNNHYVADAGRNSEFEDRLIANQDWLKRLFVLATLRKMGGVVIFTDGDPDLLSERKRGAAFRRDGFREIRRAISRRAAGFPGRVLVVHGHPAPDREPSGTIRWSGNLGVLAAGPPWTKVRVNPTAPALFSVAGEAR
ncbi:MAG: hypothetical protein ACO1N5_12405 [Noviherbaspirillum sp.]